MANLRRYGPTAVMVGVGLALVFIPLLFMIGRGERLWVIPVVIGVGVIYGAGLWDGIGFGRRPRGGETSE